MPLRTHGEICLSSPDPPLTAPPRPPPRLSLAITGHRESNASFAANRAKIHEVLSAIFDQIELGLAAEAQTQTLAPTRLHSLLVDGADQMAMALGKARGFELVAPLPFGRNLNTAINAHPLTREDAEALLAGREAADPAVETRAAAMRAWEDDTRLFELADRDHAIAPLLLAKLANPGNLRAAQAYNFAASQRVALAARVMLEQSDLLIAIWDGASTSFTGGTGATVALALDMGTPVLWIDARSPESWRLLFSPEALAGSGEGGPQGRNDALVLLVRKAVGGGQPAEHGYAAGVSALDTKHWHPRSQRVWHGYRRIEALFGADGIRARFRDLHQTYETPDAILTGSAAASLAAAAALSGQDGAFVSRIKADMTRRFAWADGISARLSDTYRGGMILNFLFSAFAIVGGIA